MNSPITALRPNYYKHTSVELDKIGFYTLSNKRAKDVTRGKVINRCEIIITDACNFKCKYCRGLKSEISGTRTLEEFKSYIDLISSTHKLNNIRISGGEPTVHPDLLEMVKYAYPKVNKHIAISTNGSASTKLYLDLIRAGVNDFSISLDACCASYGDMMSGVPGSWDKVIRNIKIIARRTYVTVGVVVTDETVNELPSVIKFAHDLGVADIRIISSAQYNKLLDVADNIDNEILESHPILKYRIENIRKNRNVRGLRDDDTNDCGLVFDDIAIAGKFHYPCIIYMREGGDPIGEVGENMIKDRYTWFQEHDSKKDKICSKNCLDVCIDYNNRFNATNSKRDMLKFLKLVPRERVESNSVEKPLNKVFSHLFI